MPFGTADAADPAIPEFIEMIADTGAGLYACQASVDLFYELAAGGQIIYT